MVLRTATKDENAPRRARFNGREEIFPCDSVGFVR